MCAHHLANLLFLRCKTCVCVHIFLYYVHYSRRLPQNRRRRTTNSAPEQPTSAISLSLPFPAICVPFYYYLSFFPLAKRRSRCKRESFLRLLLPSLPSSFLLQGTDWTRIAPRLLPPFPDSFSIHKESEISNIFGAKGKTLEHCVVVVCTLTDLACRCT